MTHYFTSAMVLACLWLDPKYADRGIFVRGGPTLRKLFRFCFFLVDEGKEGIQLQLKAGHHRFTSETPWCFAGGPIMAKH